MSENEDTIARLRQEWNEAVADEEDAASRASALADELRDLGVDPETDEEE